MKGWLFFPSCSLSTTIEAGNQTLLGPAQKMQIAGFWFHNKERTGTSLCVPLSCDGLRQTRRLFPLQSEFSRIDSAPSAAARVRLQRRRFLRGLGKNGIISLRQNKSSPITAGVRAHERACVCVCVHVIPPQQKTVNSFL